MNKKSSPKKITPGSEQKKELMLFDQSAHQKPGNRVILTGGSRINNKIICVARKDSDSFQINDRMSPESMKILQETRWSENGFIPSFKVTDKILIEAAMRTYRPYHSSSS